MSTSPNITQGALPSRPPRPYGGTQRTGGTEVWRQTVSWSCTAGGPAASCRCWRHYDTGITTAHAGYRRAETPRVRPADWTSTHQLTPAPRRLSGRTVGARSVVLGASVSLLSVGTSASRVDNRGMPVLCLCTFQKSRLMPVLPARVWYKRSVIPLIGRSLAGFDSPCLPPFRCAPIVSVMTIHGVSALLASLVLHVALGRLMTYSVGAP